MMAGNVLAALGRRIACRLKIVADLDIGSVDERGAGDETGLGNAGEIRVGVGERLVEVVHTGCDRIADCRRDRPVMAGRVVVDVDGPDLKEVGIDVGRSHRRRLVSLAHERPRIDAVLLVEGVIHLGTPL